MSNDDSPFIRNTARQPFIRNTARQPGRLYCENCGALIAPEHEGEWTLHNPTEDGGCDHTLVCSEECALDYSLRHPR